MRLFQTRRSPRQTVDQLLEYARSRESWGGKDDVSAAYDKIRAVEHYNSVYEAAGVPDRIKMEGELPTSVRFDAQDDGHMLVLTGPIDLWCGDFEGVIQQILRTETPKIEVKISSPGGDLFYGLALSMALRERADAGTEIVSRSLGVIASAATLVYLAGDKRYAAGGTTFMTHAPAMLLDIIGFFDEGAINNIRDYLRDAETQLRAITDSVAEYMADRIPDETPRSMRTLLSEERWWKMEDLEASKIVNAKDDYPEKDDDEKKKTRGRVDKEVHNLLSVAAEMNLEE